MISYIPLWWIFEVVRECGLRGACGVDKGFSSPLMRSSLEDFSGDRGRGAELMEKRFPPKKEVIYNCNCNCNGNESTNNI